MNNEISELIEGLIKATKILKKDGKLIIVSFHSIEDKIIKFFSKILLKINQEAQDIIQILIKRDICLKL